MHESWTGLPFPPPGHLPDPGIKHKSPASPALQADSLPAEPPGKPPRSLRIVPKCFCLLILKIIYCTDSECKINVYWTRYSSFVYDNNVTSKLFHKLVIDPQSWLPILHLRHLAIQVQNLILDYVA